MGIYREKSERKERKLKNEAHTIAQNQQTNTATAAGKKMIQLQISSTSNKELNGDVSRSKRKSQKVLNALSGRLNCTCTACGTSFERTNENENEI